MWIESAYTPSTQISPTDYPSLLDTVPKRQKHASIQKGQPAKPPKPRQKLVRIQQEAVSSTLSRHPALERQKDVTITDLGPGLCRDLLNNIGTTSSNTASQLTATCSLMRNVGSGYNALWKRAVDTEFDLPEPFLPGIPPFRTFQFLCKNKSLLRNFIINENAGRKRADRPTLRNVYLLKIQVLATGLTVSVLRRRTVWHSFVEKGPFLEATTSGEDNVTDLLDVRPCTEDNSSSQAIEDYRTYSMEQWLNKGHNVPEWLQSAALQNSFFNEVQSLLATGHLLRLQTDHKGFIPPEYLLPDGSLPLSLPKAGLFDNYRMDIQVIVSYSGGEMIFSQVVQRQIKHFIPCVRLKLASAMVMTVEEQCTLDKVNYAICNRGLKGNPRDLSDGQHIVTLTDDYNTHPYNARAWYTSVPVTRPLKHCCKVIVENHNTFRLINYHDIWIFRRRNDLD